MVMGMGCWGGIDWQFGIDMYTAVFKTDNQQGPTV